MKRAINLLLLITLPLFSAIHAENVTVDQKQSKIEVTGTSTLHDWELSTSAINGTSSIAKNGNGQIEISNTKITIKSTDLKSGNSGLDKKAYEALMTDKHANITFVQTAKVEVAEKNDEFTAKVSGNLVIAGKSKPATITIKGQALQNSYKISGNVPLKMTEFGIEPPKAMMGTIKSGDDIVVKFNAYLK